MKRLVFVLLLAFVLALSTSYGSVFAYPFLDIKGHWSEGFVDVLVEKGIVSKSQKAFRPNDSLNRAELVKLVIESTGGVRPALLPTTASFPDVTKDAWFYAYVENAKRLGIVSGYADGRFGPADSVTREQAAKIVVSALSVPSVPSLQLPFADVRAHDWSYAFIHSAFHTCMIDGVSSKVFNKTRNLTRAEAARMIAKALQPDVTCRTTLASIPAPPTVESPPSPTTSAPVLVPDEVQKVAVRLQSLENLGRTIPRQASNVPFVRLALTAPGSTGVKLLKLKMHRSGVGDLRSLEKLKLFEGVVRRGSERNLNRDEGSVEFLLHTDPLIIPAGQTKVLTVYVDVNAAAFGGQHRLSLLSAADVSVQALDGSTGIAVSTVAPLHGEYFNIVDVAAGALDVSFRPLSSTKVETGGTDVELARIQFSESGGQENVLLRSLHLEFDGANDGELVRLWLDWNGKRVSSEVDMVRKEKAFFDLSSVTPGGFVIPKSSSKTLSVRADIVGARDDSVTVKFDRFKSDILAIGARFGFGARLQQTGFAKSPTVTISGGDIGFSFLSRARDISAGRSDIEFGQLVLHNSGEAVSLDELHIEVLPSDGGNLRYVSRLRLVSLADGATVMGPFDMPTGLSDNVSALIRIEEDVVLRAGGALTLSVRMDIKPNAPASSSYSLRFPMNGVRVTGLDSGRSSAGGSSSEQRHDIRPSGVLVGHAVSISSPSILVFPQSDDDGFFVERTSNARLWSGIISAKNTSDVRIRKLVFGLEGTAAATDIAEFSLFKIVNNQLIPLQLRRSAVSATRTVTFSGMKESDGSGGILLPADGEVSLLLLGDVAAQVSASGVRVQMVLSAGLSDAFDEDGGAVSLSSNLPLKGPLVTLEKGGFFSVFLDTASPSERLVHSREKGVVFGAFEFEARGESVDIDRLGVVLHSVDTSSSLGIDVLGDTNAVANLGLFYKKSGLPVLKRNGLPATLVPDVSGKAVFDSLSLRVVADEDVVLEVRGDIRGFAGSSTTAKSGMAFQVAISVLPVDTRVRGVFTGVTYSDTAIDVTKNGGDEVLDVTASAKPTYVVSQRLLVKKSLTQPKVLISGSKRDLLYFSFPIVGDLLHSAYIKSLKVQIASSGDACIGENANCSTGTLYLYDDDGGLIGVGTRDSTPSSAGIWNIIVGSDGGTGLPLSDKIVQISNVAYYPIHEVSLPFILKGDVYSGVKGDSLFVSIAVNGSRPATMQDGITWRDSGSTGLNGVDMPWIYLGVDDRETRSIENSLKK